MGARLHTPPHPTRRSVETNGGALGLVADAKGLQNARSYDVSYAVRWGQGHLVEAHTAMAVIMAHMAGAEDINLARGYPPQGIMDMMMALDVLVVPRRDDRPWTPDSSIFLV